MVNHENRQNVGEENSEINKEASRLFAQPCFFVLGAAQVGHFPISELPEIAFVGRSNVGKSSLINSLVNRRNLVKTSKTPGRTQQINFFNLAERLMLVDLPGYGYAKASKRKIDDWTQLMLEYLQGRVQLKRVFVLIDARHGLKGNDEEMFTMLDENAVSYQIILTKGDKINRTQQEKVFSLTSETIKHHPAAFPEVILTSAEKKFGIDQMRTAILNMI